MGIKRVKELTEHELGLLIYQYCSKSGLEIAKMIYCHKNQDTPIKRRSKNLANVIFNNKEVEV